MKDRKTRWFIEKRCVDSLGMSSVEVKDRGCSRRLRPRKTRRFESLIIACGIVGKRLQSSTPCSNLLMYENLADNKKYEHKKGRIKS